MQYGPPLRAVIGGTTGAMCGGLLGYLAASWTGNGDKAGTWAAGGAAGIGGLSALGGATCSGGLDCLGAVVPQVFGTLVLLPPAMITWAVREA
jgi:hypothetical protein